MLIASGAQSKAKGHTSDALASLMALQPSSAVLLRVGPDGALVEKEIRVELVEVGDVLKVRQC